MKIPHIIFSAGLDRALAWTMLHSIWQATLIAVLAGLMLLAMRHRSARFRYGVVNLALLAVLLTSAGTFGYYLCTPRTLHAVVSGLQIPISATAPVIAPAGNADALFSPARVAKVVVVQNDLRKQLRKRVAEHRTLIVGAWFVGLTIFLGRLLAGITRVHYLRNRMNHPADPYWEGVLRKLVRQSGCKSGVALLESALVRSPLTIGYLKPLILFPIGFINHLSEAEVEAILAHELAHIVRRDYLFNILQSVVEAIFYFHPAVWWLSGRVREERESACDDQAIALLGNKITYVKALVTIQEMAFSPLHPALAFAGSKRSHLLLRIQRLFSPTSIKFNIMEKWIATAMVLCSLLALAFGQRITTHTVQKQRAQISIFQSPAPKNDQVEEAATFAHNFGLWEATFNGDSVCMTFSSKNKEDHWVNGECFAKKSFTDLSGTPGETSFQMVRAAGTLAMTGKIEGNTGYGRFQFTPDAGYRTTLTQQGVVQVDDELLIHCFFANFPADYLSFLKKTGYTTVSRDELLELAIFRLDEIAVRGYTELAASLGDKKVSLEDLVELKVANVSPEKVSQLTKAGYKDLDINEVSQLSLHDVDPAFIEFMNNLGFGQLSFDEIMGMKIHGITAAFVQQSQGMELGKLSLEDIMSMKTHNIDAAFIRQARQMDLGTLTLDDFLALRIHHITPEMAKTFRDLGFVKLSIDDLVSARIHAVTPEFITGAAQKGYRFPTLEEYADYKVNSQARARRAE